MENSKNDKYYKDRDTLAEQLKALRKTEGGKEDAKELLKKVRETKGYLQDKINKALKKRTSNNTEKKEEIKTVEISKEMQKINADISLKISQGDTSVNLNGLTTVEGLVLPEGLKEVHLNGLKIAEGLVPPEGLKWIRLNGLTTAEKDKLREQYNVPVNSDHLLS
jgi:hypothetical protein